MRQSKWKSVSAGIRTFHLVLLIAAGAREPRAGEGRNVHLAVRVI